MPKPTNYAPYYQDSSITIYHGDCREVLPLLSPVDACLCDPPYGLNFMGKGWDHGVPDSEVWAEVLRVLKPGAPLLAFGGTRTFHRLACAIEDGGFILSDTLCWLHGQGFPKGHAQLKPAWEPITLAWKKGNRALAIDAGRIGSAAIESGRAGRSECASIALGGGKLMSTARAESFGRWPANVLLDEEAAAALDEQAPNAGGGSKDSRGAAHWNRASVRDDVYVAHDAHGGASRFFYCAKASRAERGEGNDHPTVKPLALIRYLSKLICPATGGTLVDPFMGSGTTLLAGRKSFARTIGIELEERYCEIAANRLRQSALEIAEVA